MKPFLYLVLIAGLFSSVYILFDQIRSDINLSENIPLSKYVIGKWDNKDLAHSTVRGVVPELHFVNENKLIFRVVITDDAYDEEAKYKFIDNDIIKLQGKRDATEQEWRLKRIGEKLEICYTETSCITYTSKRIELWWLLVTSSTTVLAFYFLDKFYHMQVSTPNLKS